ncbi:hypothetical protein MHYP_G00262920 [Metynnis hypsauchen]
MWIPRINLYRVLSSTSQFTPATPDPSRGRAPVTSDWVVLIESGGLYFPLPAEAVSFFTAAQFHWTTVLLLAQLQNQSELESLFLKEYLDKPPAPELPFDYDHFCTRTAFHPFSCAVFRRAWGVFCQVYHRDQKNRRNEASGGLCNRGFSGPRCAFRDLESVAEPEESSVTPITYSEELNHTLCICNQGFSGQRCAFRDLEFVPEPKESSVTPITVNSKKDKEKGNVACSPEYQNFCVHGVCQYSAELNHAVCICKPEYSGERHTTPVLPDVQRLPVDEEEKSLPVNKEAEGYNQNTEFVPEPVKFSITTITVSSKKDKEKGNVACSPEYQNFCVHGICQYSVELNHTLCM